MALILAMQTGRSFYVGDTRVEVLDKSTPHDVHVRVYESAWNREYHLNRDSRVQILPDVFATVGIGSGKSMLKLALEAPRSVSIMRDSLYDDKKAQA